MISLNTSQPILNFTDISLKPGSPETSKNSISKDLNTTGIEIIRKSFKDNKLNDNKVLRFRGTKSENDMFLMTESETQLSRKCISQEVNTDIRNTNDIKTFETNNQSKDTNIETKLENMFLNSNIESDGYETRFNELNTIDVIESELHMSRNRKSQELNTNIGKFEIWRKIDENIKIQIKYFYAFNDYNSLTNVLLITFEDKVFGFGNNIFGVLGFGHMNEMNEVTEVPELKGNNIKEFYNGLEFVIAMNCERNELFGWGVNTSGQLGRGYKSGINDYSKPEKLKSFENKKINQISCGELHTIILTDDGLLYGWGSNKYGQIGIENIDYILEPKEIDFFSENKIKIKSIFL